MTDSLAVCFWLFQVVSVDVSGGFPPCTGVLSPLSATTALLTLLYPEPTSDGGLLLNELVSQGSDELSTDLPDIVSSVLNHVYDCIEDEQENSSGEVLQYNYSMGPAKQNNSAFITSLG